MLTSQAVEFSRALAPVAVGTEGEVRAPCSQMAAGGGGRLLASPTPTESWQLGDCFVDSRTIYVQVCV